MIRIACETSRRKFVLSCLVGSVLFHKRPAHAAEDHWPDERQAGPFLFRADFRLDHLRPLVDELVDLQQVVQLQLGVEATPEPIHMFLFQRKSTYHSYMRHYFPKAPTRRAMYVKQRGQGMVFAYTSEDLPVDLRHECTHALLHAVLPMVPLWLDEGLAEYYELPAAARASKNPYLSALQWHIRLGLGPRIEKLESIESLEQMGQAEYRDAWAWVHFMLHGPRAAQLTLTQYLADIAALTPPGTLSDRLRREIPDLRQAFAAHFRTWT